MNARPKFLGVGGPTPFANFSKIVDPNGRLNFGGKAVLHAKGVDFSNGSSFSINMDELTLMEELGKGNYGTVQKVFHKPTKVVMAMKVTPPPPFFFLLPPLPSSLITTCHVSDLEAVSRFSLLTQTCCFHL